MFKGASPARYPYRKDAWDLSPDDAPIETPLTRPHPPAAGALALRLLASGEAWRPVTRSTPTPQAGGGDAELPRGKYVWYTGVSSTTLPLFPEPRR